MKGLLPFQVADPVMKQTNIKVQKYCFHVQQLRRRIIFYVAFWGTPLSYEIFRTPDHGSVRVAVTKLLTANTSECDDK